MKYDCIVIGSGPGGYIAALRCAQLGLKTACVERRPTLGGTCLNIGCIPSKTLLHSTEFFSHIQKRAADIGVRVQNVSVDFTKMMSVKEKTVFSFTKGIEGLFKRYKIDWIKGHGRFKGSHEVEVEGQTFEAKSIILATGSQPTSLPFLPFDETLVLSSTGALALSSIPKKMLIIGAGVIGVELGSVYQRIGSEVVFIERLDRICPSFDLDVSKSLLKSLTSQGMTFHLSHKVIKAELSHGVSLTVQGPEKESVLRGDVVLVAVGRQPCSGDLRLEEIGIQTDTKGFVQIDAAFRTFQPHIFAIGDLIEGPMLAHKASEEGMAVAELIAGQRPKVDYFSIPSVVYTWPEAAGVGLTEEEIKARGLTYRVALFPFKANSRSRCIGEEEGFVKILAEEKSHTLLGIHILGAQASELISEATLAITHRLTAEALANTCHPHPTLSEAMKEAALALFQGPLHL